MRRSTDSEKGCPMAATLMPSNRRAVAEASDMTSKLSWIYLISGVIWILFGAVVLSLELDYVGRYTVALLVGGFLMGWGVFQFVGAVLHQRSHWVFHAVGGVLAIGAGVVAVSWPDVTLFTLTLIIGFSLIVWGILDIASAFAVYGYRHWWLYLIRGVAAATLGGHRAGPPGRDAVLPPYGPWGRRHHLGSGRPGPGLHVPRGQGRVRNR